MQTKGESMMTNPVSVPAIAGALLASYLLLAGCGGRTKVSDAAPPEAAVQTEYRIGPGDSLQVFVWNHPELTVTVPVRPDGLISTPLVENMQAGNKTPSQLSRDLELFLARHRAPRRLLSVAQRRVEDSDVSIAR